MPRWTGNILLLLGSLVVSAALLEGAMALVLTYPAILPRSDGPLGKPLTLVSRYYKNRNRWVVQYHADCAQYDPELTYTLRPGGTCRIVNPDDAVRYSANAQGLRDSEAALEEPLAVVLGDSHAMGWGVDASESFPKQMEERLGGPVLNAGISSYGTARQLLLLERLQLPDVNALVIQYGENDFGENRASVEEGKLRIMSEAQYRALVERHARSIRYYPLKHVRSMVGALFESPEPTVPSPAASDTAEARYFLELLDRHRKLVEHRTVVVLELNGKGRDDGRFIQALRHLLAKPRYAELGRWVSALDVSPELTAADYLRLDGHMTTRGHGTVARLVAEELQRRGVQPS